MTFGYGSPGFDPFHCPDIPEGEMWNVMCIDPIDGPLFFLGMLAVFGAIGIIARWGLDNDE